MTVCPFAVRSLGFDDRSDVLPVYIGDDRTDEDAFKVQRIKQETNLSSVLLSRLFRLLYWF